MPKPLRCPALACGGRMYPERRRGVAADRCERCRSLWFDAQELDHWLVDIASVDLRPPESRIPERGVGSRPCPRCERALDTAGWTDLVLDRCRACRGLFVEANELVRMQEEGLPTEPSAFESRLAELLVEVGETLFTASQIPIVVMRFLRR